MIQNCSISCFFEILRNLVNDDKFTLCTTSKKLWYCFIQYAHIKNSTSLDTTESRELLKYASNLHINNQISFIYLSKDLINLTYLNLQLVGIANHNCLKNICNGLKEITNLESFTLDLSKNDISYDMCHLICKNFNLLHNLTIFSLNISHCNISTDFSIIISNNFKFLNNITDLSLDFSWNKIYQQGVKNIMGGISHLKSLHKLSINFGNNNIRTSGLGHLSNGLIKFSKLEVLDIGLVGINIDNTFTSLINIIKKMNTLKYLDLHFNIYEIDHNSIQNINKECKEININHTLYTYKPILYPNSGINEYKNGVLVNT